MLTMLSMLYALCWLPYRIWLCIASLQIEWASEMDESHESALNSLEQSGADTSLEQGSKGWGGRWNDAEYGADYGGIKGADYAVGLKGAEYVGSLKGAEYGGLKGAEYVGGLKGADNAAAGISKEYLTRTYFHMREVDEKEHIDAWFLLFARSLIYMHAAITPLILANYCDKFRRSFKAYITYLSGIVCLGIVWDYLKGKKKTSAKRGNAQQGTELSIVCGAGAKLAKGSILQTPPEVGGFRTPTRQPQHPFDCHEL